VRIAHRAAAWLGILVLGLASAGFHCGEAPQVKLGEPFDLRGGERASVAGGELELAFVAVPQDSRCPKGEQCIVAGKAVVSLEATPSGGEAVRFELEADPSSETAETDVLGFRIRLLGLSPYPITGRPILFQDYLAKITILRL
jgi:hypothetical protein